MKETEENEILEKVKKWHGLTARYFKRLKRKTGLNFTGIVWDFSGSGGTYCQLWNSFTFSEEGREEYKKIFNKVADTCALGISSEIYHEKIKNPFIDRVKDLQAAKNNLELADKLVYLFDVTLAKIDSSNGNWISYLYFKILVWSFKKVVNSLIK